MPRIEEIESERTEGESIGESFKSEISKELNKKAVSKKSVQITYKKSAKTKILFRKKDINNVFQK